MESIALALWGYEFIIFDIFLPILLVIIVLYAQYKQIVINHKILAIFYMVSFVLASNFGGGTLSFCFALLIAIMYRSFFWGYLNEYYQLLRGLVIIIVSLSVLYSGIYYGLIQTSARHSYISTGGARIALEKTGLPNIVFIVMDTVNFRHTTVGGYFRNTTPNLLALARQSHQFAHMFAISDSASSEMPSIFTSRPWFKLKENMSIYAYNIREHPPDILGYLSSIGYNILIVDPVGLNQLLDFKQYSIIYGDWSHIFSASGWIISLAERHFRLRLQHANIQYGLDRFQSINLNEQREHYKYIATEKYLTKAAIKKPFFLWIHIMPPHDPYSPPLPYRGMFSRNDKESIPLHKPSDLVLHLRLRESIGKDEYLIGLKRLSSPKSIELFDLFYRYNTFDGTYRLANTEEARRQIQALSAKEFDKNYKLWSIPNQILDHLKSAYDEHLAYADFILGKYIKLLKHLNLYDDSIIICLSDHGEAFENGHLFHTNGTPTEVVHSPMFVRLPNQPSAKGHNSLTNHLDISPGILSLLKVRQPDWMEGSPLPFDDQSFRTVSVAKSSGAPICTIIRPPYKLDYNFETKMAILYNYQLDPQGKHDLSDKNPLLVKELKRLLWNEKYGCGEG